MTPMGLIDEPLFARWKSVNGDANFTAWAMEVGWTGRGNYAQRLDAAYLKLCIDAGRPAKDLFNPQATADAIEETHIIHQYFVHKETGYLVALFSDAAVAA